MKSATSRPRQTPAVPQAAMIAPAARAKAKARATASGRGIPRAVMMTMTADGQRIVDAIGSRRRFVLSSHSRPDGDSIGSQLAMAYALRYLGKEVRIVNKDHAPAPLLAFPGVAAIEIA